MPVAHNARASFEEADRSPDHSVSWKTALKDYAKRFGELLIPTYAGALAFFGLISLAPLVTILLWVITLVFPGAQDVFVREIGTLAGPQVAGMVRTVMENAQTDSGGGTVALVTSIVGLLLGATVAFGQLQVALNHIFGKSEKHLTGVFAWLKKRLLSFGAILVLGLLLVGMIVAQAFIGAMTGADASAAGGDGGGGGIWSVLLPIFSFIVAAIAFAAMYYWLPDRDVSKKRAIQGGVVTAVLFIIGRWAIGLYLGRSNVGSAYGAAGDLAVMLVWLYYSAIVIMAGALATAMLDEFEHAKLKLGHKAD